MPELNPKPLTNAPAPTPSSTPPSGTASSPTKTDASSPTPSPTPPSPAPTPTPAPTPISAKDFRFPASDDIEPWARGKSAEEVLAIARGYHAAFDRSGAAPAPSVPAPAPAPTYAPQSYQAIPDDTIITGKDLRGILAQTVAAYSAPVQQSMEMAASGVYGIARQQYRREFERYGPEIQQELAKIPRQLWTLDNLDTVVTLIRGRHTDDYARERAQELVAQMDPTIRSMGGGSEPVPTAQQKSNTLESDAIPSDWKARAKAQGITEATVREFCATNDMTPEDFFKMFEKSPLQPIVAEVPNVR